MKNTLKINLNSPRFKSFQKLLPLLEGALKMLDIDFYVVGAIARDITFANDKINMRATKDIDLAVFINSRNQYDNLKKYLIEEIGFRATNENSLSLLSPDDIQLDLIPFGEIEVVDGEIVEKESLGKTRINGFVEVYHSGTEEIEVEGGIFKVASPASIVLLKLIASNDRPEMRGNDAQDVACIIKYFFQLNDEKIWNDHNDLFGDNQESNEIIAAKVIGRELKFILSENEDLKARILDILRGHITAQENSRFVIGMVGDYCDSIETAIAWLERIREHAL